MKANIAPFGLRMQPELKMIIKQEAKRNNRSMNSEIIHRLEKSVKGACEMTGKDRLVKHQDKIIFRAPDGMRERLKVAAKRNNISMNELILEILEQHFPAPNRLSERLSNLADAVKVLRENVNVDEVIFFNRKIEELFSDINSGLIPLDDDVAKGTVARFIEQWGKHTK